MKKSVTIRLAAIAAAVGIGTGAFALSAPPQEADALADVTFVCVGDDLYIFTSDGGSGVWYNSNRC